MMPPLVESAGAFSMSRLEIRSYDYVNHPYAKVREALVQDPIRYLQGGDAIGGRPRALGRGGAPRDDRRCGSLAEIVFTIGAIEDATSGAHGSPLTRIPVSWEAATHPRFFPLMNSVLMIYPLTATETQLDFLGRYDPPLGVVGEAMNALVSNIARPRSIGSSPMSRMNVRATAWGVEQEKERRRSLLFSGRKESSLFPFSC